MGRLASEHRNQLVERYFPHASHQVIILSTDTEIEVNYFEQLKPSLARAYHLSYDEAGRMTRVEQGYFWQANAKEQLIRLKTRTGIQQWNILCRWALCRSLKELTPPTPIDIPADSNVEMTWQFSVASTTNCIWLC